MMRAFAISDTAVGTCVGEDVDGTADSIALPTIDGNEATEVLVSVSTATYIRPGSASLPATLDATNGHLLGPGETILLNVRGQTHMHHLQVSAGGRITVTAVR